MTRSRRRGRTEEEMAAELHKHRDDAGEWSDEPVDIEVKRVRSEVISFRLPREELDSLLRAAEMTEETLSQFIRNAIAFRIHGRFVTPTVEIIGGPSRLVLHSSLKIARGTENPSEIVEIPDYPPSTVAVTR